MFAHNSTEIEVISRARQGDEDAYELLYRHYKSHVFSLCLRIIKNTSDAEDITQDVFLQLFRNLSSFRGEAKFWTWLHRITVNCTLMHLRKRGVATTSLLWDAEDNCSSSGSTAEAKQTTFAMNRVALQQAVKRLTAKERSVLLLHDIDGLTHGEIAQRLRLSVSCSRSRLHRARLELRENLST